MNAQARLALKVRGLCFRWPGAAWALQIPALELAAGERVFLQGSSGSGKSTLLNLVAGTLRPDAGEIEIDGVSMTALGAAGRDRLRADHIGVIFQQFNLLPFLSARQNVLLACRFSARRRQRARTRFGSLQGAAQALLQRLGLAEVALGSMAAARLSVGQQQRVAAARAVIGGPGLVIADEPTSALDADARDAFVELLFSECAAAGAALLLVSHDAALGGHFDRVLRMADFVAGPMERV